MFVHVLRLKKIVNSFDQSMFVHVFELKKLVNSLVQTKIPVFGHKKLTRKHQSSRKCPFLATKNLLETFVQTNVVGLETKKINKSISERSRSPVKGSLRDLMIIFCFQVAYLWFTSSITQIMVFFATYSIITNCSVNSFYIYIERDIDIIYYWLAA